MAELAARTAAAAALYASGRFLSCNSGSHCGEQDEFRRLSRGGNGRLSRSKCLLIALTPQHGIIRQSSGFVSAPGEPDRGEEHSPTAANQFIQGGEKQ
jgi:hypothetical protein